MNAYRTSDVALITGFSLRQLDYWAQQGILEPSIQQSHGPGTRRLYSFEDIIQIRFIRQLKQHGWSTRKIRQAIVHFRQVMGHPNPLKSAIFIDGKHTILAICNTKDGERLLLDTLNAGEQHVMWIVLETLAEATQHATQQSIGVTTVDTTITWDLTLPNTEY